MKQINFALENNKNPDLSFRFKTDPPCANSQRTLIKPATCRTFRREKCLSGSSSRTALHYLLIHRSNDSTLITIYVRKLYTLVYQIFFGDVC